MIKNVKAIQKTIHETTEWLNDLMDAYDFKDENKAFVLLRATVTALRDRIYPGEVFHLGSQLPALIRGFLYEGWDPDKASTDDKTPYDFLTSVRMHLGGHEDIDLERAVPEALRIIFERIDQGEALQVKNNLPKEIQEILTFES